MADKKLHVEIEVETAGYNVVVYVDGADDETEYAEESIAGVKGRIAAIVDNLGTYFPPEPSAPGEGAVPEAVTPDTDDEKDEDNDPGAK